MLQKVLVANRGEIAIRAFRAAYELGIRTVAVYTPDDRTSLHRQKADEAYEIGEMGHPVHGYLDVGALVETALGVGADAVYPGYGFLSESAKFAAACEEAGLTFVGPPPEVLRLTGDKLRARWAAAKEAGISVLRASDAVVGAGEALEVAQEIGYPVREKADPDDPGHVAAPMTGVVTISVEEGDGIDEGQQVATIEAMKMESAVRALKNGKVKQLAVTSGSNVEPGDLLIVLGLEECAIE